MRLIFIDQPWKRKGKFSTQLKFFCGKLNRHNWPLNVAKTWGINWKNDHKLTFFGAEHLFNL
jgi:hypothetical protein